MNEQGGETEIVTWLTQAGLEGVDADALFQGFCERLHGAGIPLARSAFAMSTVHPQIRAVYHIWRRGEGLIETDSMSHFDLPREAWWQSPFHYMLTERIRHLRRRLTGPKAALDFPVLREFRKEGVTDWLGLATPFGGGAQHEREAGNGMVTSWVTDREGGFTDQQADMIERLVRVFSLAVKATATYRMARTLLATYVGDDVADKVLSGKIQRGSSDSIDAVLLIADLRGFTTLADSMPRRELLAALNDYHDCMTAPVEGRGGQVLKFLGDGLLATFDLAKGEREAVCEVALKAAVEAGQRVERLNAERARAGKPVMQLDQALHLGSVLYGNIGSELRLDFTVIGPAVNEVARMEGLCKKLGVNLLISEEVVSAAPACANDLVTFGRHRLRGVKRDQELFGLKREAALKKRVS